MASKEHSMFIRFYIVCVSILPLSPEPLFTRLLICNWIKFINHKSTVHCIFTFHLAGKYRINVEPLMLKKLTVWIMKKKNSEYFVEFSIAFPVRFLTSIWFTSVDSFEKHIITKVKYFYSWILECFSCREIPILRVSFKGIRVFPYRLYKLPIFR